MAKAEKGDRKKGVKKDAKKKMTKMSPASKKSSGAGQPVKSKTVKKAKPRTPARPVPKAQLRPKPSRPQVKIKKAKPKAAPAKGGIKSSPPKAGKFAAPGLELGIRPPAGMLSEEKKVRQKVPPVDTIKKRFIKMKEDLLREVANRIESETDHRYEIGDIYDLATSERDREFSLLVGNRTRQRLQEIDAALDRIGDKSYGFCEDCGQRISAGRILAMPFTRLCVKCKEEAEKKEEEESMLEQQDEEERVYEGLEEAEDFEEE